MLNQVQHDKSNVIASGARQSGAAFTLAEVLITLVIVGVIAAVTIPTLLSKYQDFALATQRKKAYSEFLNIYSLALKNDEFVTEMRSYNDVVTNFKVLQEKLKVVKSCNNSLEEGCWTDTCMSEEICIGTTAAMNNQAKSVGFIDTAGRQWVHYKPEHALEILVDVNGDKGPNRYGKDRIVIIAFKDFGVYGQSNGSSLLEKPTVRFVE